MSEGPSQQSIDVRRADGVVTVTLWRPERKNAIDLTAWRELLAVFREVAASGEDRALVLTGRGDDFSSGADILDPAVASMRPFEYMNLVRDVCLALHGLPQPTLARLDGIVAGAGLNLALACDLVVASSRARLCEIFARRGLSVDGGGSWLLPRLVGLHRAKQLVLLADWVEAAEAERIGLVNRVVPGEELDAAVGDWAARLASGPPIALAQSKALLHQAFSGSFAEALDAETRAQTVNYRTRDTAEAVRAFAEKREPNFEGR